MDPAFVVGLAALSGLVALAFRLSMARAAVTIGPDSPSETTTTAQTIAPGLPPEPLPERQ